MCFVINEHCSISPHFSATFFSLKYFDSIDNVILDLKYGKSEASAIDSSLLPRFQTKYPNLKVLFLPLPEEMQSLGNGICINQDDQELALKVKKSKLYGSLIVSRAKSDCAGGSVDSKLLGACPSLL